MKKVIVLSTPDGESRAGTFVHALLEDTGLGEYWDGKYISTSDELKLELSDVTNGDIILAIIATGGTRKIASMIPPLFEKIPVPVVFISYPENNSLAAMLDILWDFRKLRYPCLGVIWKKGSLENAIAVSEAYVSLRKDALIIMRNDEYVKNMIERVRNVFHMALHEMPISALVATYYRNELHEIKVPEILKRMELSDETKKKIAMLYRAIKETLHDHNSFAITIDCFELIRQIHVTPCIPFAILNSEEKYVAVCEGDIPSAVMMVLVKRLTGESGFLANVGDIDVGKNRVLFAHCTISFNIARNTRSMPHFETGLPAAIKGELDVDTVTVARFSPDFSVLRVFKGKVVQHQWNKNMCRTQVMIEIPRASLLLEKPLGNHYVIVRGDITEKLIAMGKLLQIKVEHNL